jgi:hypothetical protein
LIRSSGRSTTLFFLHSEIIRLLSAVECRTSIPREAAT